MGQVRSRKEEGDFYALEQKSLMRQADTRLSVKLFSLLYQIFSDYGRSFIRPLVGFLILTVVFLAIYYGALLGADDKLVEQYPSVIRFTFEQVFRPFNVWTKKGAEALVGLAGHKVLLVQFLATVHSLFSITLTTLFVLAIRRRFKLG
jgi:type III secretory pathway component EscU